MHRELSASEIIIRAEETRRALGLSQERLAALIGMTQGHYSKLAAGRVPPGRKAIAALSKWLRDQAAMEPNAKARRAEILRLAREISMQCMRLSRLAAKD